MSFDDFAFAAAFRQYVRKEISDMINTMRPRPRHGEVLSFNRDERWAMVQFRGADVPVKVNMSAIQPLQNGATVRVEGPVGDKLITAVTKGKVYVDS